MSDAIAMLAEAQQNSDKLFVQLEEKRIKLDAESEERYQNAGIRDAENSV